MSDKTIQCGPYMLDYGKKTLIMGVLNVTPDSFPMGVSIIRLIMLLGVQQKWLNKEFILSYWRRINSTRVHTYFS